ncbi:pentapeptide repeat-containing protein [Nocardia arthritidis]|uniref:Pentapeptide repeat-containing protein n=1 Tax=Nocardia arthritidis TaxID=228602 RepID=A0A6G9YLY3_9NOCA|nr:pentapeptide repeat-containing protein [Nocardia arthritidis]QIS14289.1 pentapeptide repeat-containing protein [Nocardia arthritidis]
MTWGRLGDRLHRAALLLAVVTVVVGGLGIAALTWWLLWWAFGAKAETPNQVDLTKIALSVAAGVGGAVALVVAYRRQRDLERGRFAELFGAAAKQLGDTDVAVRVAGVFAMAGVADEFSAPGRRQQCIDVLCGYLRLPYEPDDGANHLVSRKESRPDEDGSVERVYQYRQNDHEVRRTIVRVIAAHLRRSADISWSHCDFDFTGAVLEKAEFQSAVFAGRHTHFTGCRFLGPTSFEYTTFEGSHTTFRGAVFRDGAVTFDNALFGSARAEKVEIQALGTTFDEAVFESSASFEKCVFRGPRTSFLGARFAGPRTAFLEAKFRADRTCFERATLDGEHVTFHSAEFNGGQVVFAGAQFYAGMITFDEARFGAPNRLRGKGSRETDFRKAEFHGSLTFARTVLGGRSVDFTEADFFGEISFEHTRFAAGEIRFDRPKAWVGTHFDWDDNPIRKPTAVKPNPWPPTPTELRR